MFGLFKKSKKPQNASTAEVSNYNFSDVIDSITEVSIDGYSFQGLLNGEGHRPKSILGGEVFYLENDRTYIKGASSQVQIQLSKLGLKVPHESVLHKTLGYKNLVHSEEFGQHDVRWSVGGFACSISVHTEDDIFEVTCWK